MRHSPVALWNPYKKRKREFVHFSSNYHFTLASLPPSNGFGPGLVLIKKIRGTVGTPARQHPAQDRDRHTAEAVVATDAGAIRAEDACGAVALRGLLAAARADGVDVELLDLRTSADTAGDPSRVVGYGAFAVG